MNHETIFALFLKSVIPMLFSLFIFFKFIYPILIVIFNLIKVFFLLLKEGLKYLTSFLKV